MSSSSDRFDANTDDDSNLLQSAHDQLKEEALPYNQAVGSYNTHLTNHRERRDLHDIPWREPITARDEFSAALDGDAAAIQDLITYLIDQAHLDSQVRRHPRTYPIHVTATEHLQHAREQLISTLEETLHHAQDEH